VRVISLSAERPHAEFLPISRRKAAVLAAILAAIGFLSLLTWPPSLLNFGFLAILTAGLIAFLTFFAPRGPVESAEARRQGSRLHMRLKMDRERSGVLEVGELTMLGIGREESYSSVFRLEPSSSQHFSSQRSLEFSLPLWEARGLVSRRKAVVNGLIKCPGCRITLQDGQELFLAALVPMDGSLRISLGKTSLEAGGAQCILNEASEGGIRFMVSASGVAGGSKRGKVALMIRRCFREDGVEFSVEERVLELDAGGGGSGSWKPRGLVGEERLILFNGTLSFFNIAEALGARELLMDPAPRTEYSVVLEARAGRMRSWRDEAPLTISLAGPEKD
jgi:hypothetical protein